MSSVYAKPVATRDTNLIVSGAINPHGIPSQVLQALERNAFILVSSADLIDDASGVLSRERLRQRYRPDPAIVNAILTALRAAIVRPLDLEALAVHCRDWKDDPVLACALGGSADYIVTGDEDLLVLGLLRIVTPRAFLMILEQLSSDV